MKERGKRRKGEERELEKEIHCYFILLSMKEVKLRGRRARWLRKRSSRSKPPFPRYMT